jgi:hypothetical protein
MCALGPPAVALLAASVLGAACTASNTGTGGCSFTQQAELPATPLTLLPDARLDTVADGFMLSGVTDQGMTVRWAAVDGSGAMGQEQALSLPTSGDGRWLTFTSDKQPGDTLLLVSAVAKFPDAELQISAVPSSGAPAAPPPASTLTVVQGAAPYPLAALASTRTGSNAVLAWVDPIDVDVKVLGLSPAGQALGAPSEVGPGRNAACLAFVPGKKDLTLTYYRYADPKSRIPTLVIVELLANGAVAATQEIVLDGHPADCPRLIGTDAGYTFGFHDAQGLWLAVFRSDYNHAEVVPVAAALDFGGASRQPALAGLAAAGADYALVLSRDDLAQLWRVSSLGSVLGVLPFPTKKQRFGQVSTQVAAGGLTATYADYTAGDLYAGTDGKRNFLGATCL